jgi:cation diffusion facilitator family transporter
VVNPLQFRLEAARGMLTGVSTAGGKKAILAALFANLGIAIAKFVAFLLTSSAAMLAESIHSVADTSNQALLLWGGRAAKRPPSGEFQFGFGRERYFWAFVVALVLFSLGSLFAIFEGIEKLRHPHELESAGIAVGVLVFAIALETFSFRTAIVESNKIRAPGQSWWSFVRDTRTPELPVVLLEDLGALIGLLLALAAVGLSILTGDAMWDGIGTLCIGVLLGIIAIVLAYEMKRSLIGESATAENQQRVIDAISSSEDVRRLIHVRTQHIGPEELLVAGKVEFDANLTVSGLADAIDATEQRIRAAVPIAAVIYLEPDLFEAARFEQA